MFVQLNHSTMATLGTEESSRYREVETRVNVWTVPQKKIAVVERLPLWRDGRQWRVRVKVPKNLG